jgi:outer membrane protein OmpA-like peptidoglycan-associated protein
MYARYWLALALCLTGWPARAEPCTAADPDCLPAPPRNLPPLHITIDKTRVDLARRQLEVRINRPAGKVELEVFGESGVLLAEVSRSFAGQRSGSALVVGWTTDSDEPVGKIEVFAYDHYGFYKGIAIVPWSFSVPHEEVVFETNSAVVRPSEEAKLEASMALIRQALSEHQELGKIALFVAGHTDTRGDAQHNLNLSRQRARAIATWFRQHGLTLPIAYEGFGEAVLEVKTADEVDEAKNRRADYVLSIDPPRLKSGAFPAWKQLS